MGEDTVTQDGEAHGARGSGEMGSRRRRRRGDADLTWRADYCYQERQRSGEVASRDAERERGMGNYFLWKDLALA